MSINKQNLPLILGISLPVLMILFVVGSIILPGMFTQPETNFLFTVDDRYYGNYRRYAVENGKVAERPAPAVTDRESEFYKEGTARIYLYDAAKDSTKQIDLQEAQTYTLSTESKSPDGFEVTMGSGDGGFPFFFGGSNYGERYLKGHGVSRRINTGSESTYYGNFYFLGWILP